MMGGEMIISSAILGAAAIVCCSLLSGRPITSVFRQTDTAGGRSADPKSREEPEER
jgi:hypothetical protein